MITNRCDSETSQTVSFRVTTCRKTNNFSKFHTVLFADCCSHTNTYTWCCILKEHRRNNVAVFFGGISFDLLFNFFRRKKLMKLGNFFLVRSLRLRFSEWTRGSSFGRDTQWNEQWGSIVPETYCFKFIVA